MSINPGKMGQLVAEAMDRIEQDYPDGNVEIGEVLIITEIQNKDDDVTSIRFACTDERAYVHLGLLHMAILAIEQ